MTNEEIAERTARLKREVEFMSEMAASRQRTETYELLAYALIVLLAGGALWAVLRGLR